MVPLALALVATFSRNLAMSVSCRTNLLYPGALIIYFKQELQLGQCPGSTPSHFSRHSEPRKCSVSDPMTAAPQRHWNLSPRSAPVGWAVPEIPALDDTAAFTLVANIIPSQLESSPERSTMLLQSLPLCFQVGNALLVEKGQMREGLSLPVEH